MKLIHILIVLKCCDAHVVTALPYLLILINICSDYSSSNGSCAACADSEDVDVRVSSAAESQRPDDDLESRVKEEKKSDSNNSNGNNNTNKGEKKPTTLNHESNGKTASGRKPTHLEIMK